ncbi:MAG: DNA repair protein RecN [Bacteroidia bacterium]|nr:DNA repair protein RecN [Bacteroidia bacterium]
MLKQLHIRNYAIIQQVDIHFHPKLTIITGETGAGKSILMGALSLILGERADTKSLLNTEEKCIIEGTFDINAYALSDFFEQEELDYSTTCLLRREITPNGKSRAFINDTPVTLNQLKELGAKLVDIVSQHQTLELNNGAFQLQIIDAIAENQELINNYKELHKQHKQCEKQLTEWINQEKQARADEDYLQFIFNELKEVNPNVDEQEELEKQLDILSNAEIIQQNAGMAADNLTDAEQSIVDALQTVKQFIASAAKYQPAFAEIISRIDSVIIELKDISSELNTIKENTHANPSELERVENRLQQLFNLQKKHRVSNNTELLQSMEQIQQKLQTIGSLSSLIETKQAELEKITKQLNEAADKLSISRKKVIPTIINQVNELLQKVQMPDAKIQITQNRNNQYGVMGIDAIELLFAANKGSAFQPIHKVASGGELSRLMLCIKSLISDKIALPTIIFDEIDTGISGETALKVSEVIKNHASQHQVIAITHLPQIAAKANQHLYVYKTSDTDQTKTNIKTLNKTEQVEEVARMMHGANPSATVLKAAKELVSQA